MSGMTDTQILHALHLRDHEGLTFSKIGEALGVSRASISGAFRRVDREQLACRCVKAQNKDGGMPALWWAGEVAT
ncbi:hypothetical protein [Falsirhodobacter halotolerans]|uniref:hypothetical protein n=1 Tax=Falsirhodobacter halotolerans TaxID=1146892 RepID=UPI001FD16308|nr:hypothetical protein [Falsirhodobacter halotolerans]MCJ8139588.1 hypothetical protein [Falsirhodobacter halotolerans]